MKSFRDIAVPLIRRGVPVIPVEPGGKRCLLPKWPDRASALESVVNSWHEECSSYNVGAVCKPQGILVLDCDTRGVLEQIEHETGQKLSRTFIVRSGGKQYPHVYFKQTERSRALGNRSKAEMFDLQSVDKYVVGPGSKLANGKSYDILSDAEIVDIPDWLCDWVERQDPKTKPTDFELSPVVDDFDIEDFLAWYDIEYAVKGNWYNCYVQCPAAGYQHEQCKTPGFFFDGSDFGFNCWATGCPGHGKGVGAVIKMMNENHAPYPQRIWPELELDYQSLGIDEADLPTEEANADEEPFLPPSPKRVIRIKVKDPKTGEVVIFGPKLPVAEPVVSPPVTVLAPNAEVPLVSKVVVREALPEQPAVKRQQSLREMPEDCMYGWLGRKTKELEMPLGFAYPAMLAMAAARTLSPPPTIRPTMYVCLIGPVHCGKSEVMKRAEWAFQWPSAITVLKGTPGSDRGLAKLLEIEDDQLTLQNRVMVLDEFRKMLGKMDIQNSGLAATLCELWSQDKSSTADKKSKDHINCRLSILGGLMAENPQEFAETFGEETNAGLYDRFVYGLAPKWKYEVPEIKADMRNPYPIEAPKGSICYTMANEWRDTIGQGRERLAEIALRVALVTAGMNHDKTITAECMQAALNFMTWQEAIRDHYKPSKAEQDKESRVTEIIKNALESYVDSEGKYKWVSWKKLYKNRNLWKFVAATVNRVKKAMAENGTLIEQREHDPDNEGKMRLTGLVCASD